MAPLTSLRFPPSSAPAVREDRRNGVAGEEEGGLIFDTTIFEAGVASSLT